MDPLRRFGLEVVQKLREAGFQALFAGGCVRDQLLGLEPHDYDVATDAVPEEVQRLFRRSLAVGAQFGVIEVLGPQRMHVQVATFRSDGSYSDGRRPDTVRFGTAAEDAQRRDFTLNGLFFDPVAEQVIDYVGGQADLAAKRLRAIGDPWARFEEDKLRLLRAVRFVARFDLRFDDATLAALKSMAPELNQVSAERITDELRKMAALPNRGLAFRWLHETGLLAAAFGPWAPRQAQNSFAVLAALPAPVSFPLALAAALLELWGPELDAILKQEPLDGLAERLRLSNDEKAAAGWLLERRDELRHAATLPASRLKPILAHPLCEPLLGWLAARLETKGEAPGAVDFCRERLRAWSAQELNPAPLLTGDDLRALGHAPGPDFKVWLKALRDAQLDGEIQTRAEAEARLRRLAGETKKEA